ncbi:MAG: acetyl ornithine aminotransferase family protein [Candidatus Helarchaeota archaeon]
MRSEYGEEKMSMKIPDIKTELPGPKTREIVATDKKYLITSTKVVEIVGKIGRGCTIEDVDGNIFLDFAAGVSVMNLGYSHPRIIKTIQEQAEKLIHFAGHDWYNEAQVEYAQLLCELAPGRNCEKKMFFSNSGTESVEAAAKIARWNRKALTIISFIGAFHGRTMGSLALTASKPVHQKRFLPNIGGVHVPYAYCYRCKLEYPSCGVWCADYIKEVCFETFLPPEEVAAIILEPIQGEGGYIVPPPEFLPKIRKICDDFGILLIADEVQSGFGRTGKLWGVDHYGIEPEITCCAKSIAAGVPMGATVAREELDFPEKGHHSNTYGGNLLACAAAIESLKIIQEENLVENAARQGDHILKRLREMQEKYEIIGDVRGQGLMIGIELVKDPETKKPAKEETAKFVYECYKRGLIILSCGKSVIRLIPPLIIDEKTSDIGLDIIEDSMKSISNK